MLRLTFGGAPCPLEWGSIAESICDLANAILLNDGWDPLSLQSPAQHLVPNKIILKDDIPFRIGRDLIVDIPVDSRGTVDLYIDNFCGLMVDLDDNAGRPTELKSSEVSPWLCVKGNFLNHVMLPWLRAQSLIP